MARLPTTTPTLPEVVRLAIQTESAGKFTAVPAKVISYDPASQKIKAKPTVQLRDPNTGQSNDIPIIGGIPVVFPSGGGYVITWPLLPGDPVLIVFSSNSLDDWLENGGDSIEPNSCRRNSLSDGVAIPGPFPFTAPRQQANTTDLFIGRDDGSCFIRLTPTGISVGDDTATPATKGVDNDANWSALVTWAGLVNTALSGLGAPIAPLGSIVATAATKAKVT